MSVLFVVLLVELGRHHTHEYERAVVGCVGWALRDQYARYGLWRDRGGAKKVEIHLSICTRRVGRQETTLGLRVTDQEARPVRR